VGAPGGASGWIGWPGYQVPDVEEKDLLLQVGNAGQALSSALAGLGRAMMPLPLVEEALAQGRLEAIEGPEESRQAYWLVAPRPQWRQKKVKALVEYLTGA
jgi:LysR family glycine cleavage system transcriptional activator